MAKSRLSFRRGRRPTGLGAIGRPFPDTSIKLDKLQVGYIGAPTWQSLGMQWSVHFAVEKSDINEDGNPNCTWKWVHMKTKFHSEEDARIFVVENFDALLERYTFHTFEEEVL